MAPTLQFLGGTGTVTGSKFLLRCGGAAVLVEAGLFQGVRELRRRNWEAVPVDPVTLDAVVVTHAHLDHIGYLPRLARDGLTRPVLCTPSTGLLAELVLRDSARLQQEDASYAARSGFSKHAAPQPLYDDRDVDRVLRLRRPLPFGEELLVADDARLTFQPAGHILGSAVAVVRFDGQRVVFSGDLGRPSHPLLVPPPPPPAADVVVIESTYGDRRHPPVDESDERLGDVLRRTFARGGVALMPAFAVDRTEVLLMALRRLMASGAVPRVPVYVDSPMALGALDIYRAATAAHAPDVRRGVVVDRAVFDPGDLHEVHSTAESIALNEPDHPCVIISASGMATGGRVLHHLKHLLPRARNSVLLAGYQAPGTRGRDLADGATFVKMHGEYVPVKAEVVPLDGYSVHADADELVTWLASAAEPPRTVYVVHGEPEASEALAARVRDDLGWLAVVPRDGEVVRLG